MTLTNNEYIDLHVHSSASDGTLAPREVTKLAYESGLAAYALTDHDTVAGIDEAQSTKYPIRVIPGIELSAGYGRGDIHILGLFINHHSNALQQVMVDVVNEREWRNKKMAENLATAGIDITVDRVRGNDTNAVLTRAHFARFLINNGYAKDTKEAFSKYLSESTPYFVQRKYLSPEECITLITESGGYPILAHPMIYKFPIPELDRLIKRLKNSGLYGLETIYSTYTNQEEDIVRSFAHRYSLAITGGSDFHGSNKPDIQIGSGRGNLRIPISLLHSFEQN